MMIDDERAVEYGDGPRFDDAFPARWGWPVGRRFSAERRAWITDRIRSEGGGGAHAQLAAKADRLLAILRAAERAAELDRRR